ncbi:hypothetical protein KFK09_006561 [Dendrobium nobile]|uniref:Uncharacterized protein n=1 Tax=Dendrobium nobile TaxID=94219 RepID=A0A8T3BU04_DENNO|nr:hypothetical protein KFK09_006561 [Dendrobium nobile]
MAFFSMIKVLLLCTTSLPLLFTTPASGQYSDYLLSGEGLDIDHYLTEMVYKFIIQNDCSLVLYQLTNLIWSSGIPTIDTTGKSLISDSFQTVFRRKTMR